MELIPMQVRWQIQQQMQVTSKNGRSYFEHKKPSFNSTFTVDWTSPAGVEVVLSLFMGVGNANNTNSSTSGDEQKQRILYL
ncbi:MAG: hypothetical protein IPL13_17480 [Saprospiraceae bacterium]|nr:hypothetical protein [Candidatus Brachybacter algidus]